MIENRRQFLQGTEAFRDKGKAFQTRLATELKPVEVIKGELICKEGNPFNYVFFVKSGEF